MHGLIGKTGKIILPLILASAILWWMYRGLEWEQLGDVLSHDMSWYWMLLSMLFCILEQVLREMR